MLLLLLLNSLFGLFGEKKKNKPPPPAPPPPTTVAPYVQTRVPEEGVPEEEVIINVQGPGEYEERRQ